MTEQRRLNPFIAPVSFPLGHEDAHALAAAIVFELLGESLDAAIARFSVSLDIETADRILLDEAVRSARIRCIASITEENRRLKHLVPKRYEDTSDVRDGTIEDPILPLLRELLKENDDPLSISWLLRRFSIPYGRGGRLVRILQAERRAQRSQQ